jgi:hypothetical protein
MGQADSQNTTLSRRRLLASIPALAATTAPVAATALSGLPMGDAALLVLGEKLKPLAAEIMAARAIDRQRMDEFNAKLAALGLKPEEEYQDEDAYNHERWRLCDENKALLHDREPADHREWDELHSELFAQLDDILDIQPTTLEGFTIQVLAIVAAHGELFCDEDADSEIASGITAFFCNMCRFVGVQIAEA